MKRLNSACSILSRRQWDARMKIENAADFARAFSVSHETVAKLELYERLLLQWQKAVNLVAPTTLPQVWQRHFADPLSLSLWRRTRKPGSTSGRGEDFLGSRLLLCLRIRKSAVCILWRAIAASALFSPKSRGGLGRPPACTTCASPTPLSAGAIPAADVITARALAPLDALLELALPFFGDASVGLFLKGREAGYRNR